MSAPPASSLRRADDGRRPCSSLTAVLLVDRARSTSRRCPCPCRRDRERFTRIVASGPSSRPSSSAPARACADSMAGMMPSVRLSRRSASMAAASVTGPVLGAADRGEPGVLGADARVVEAGRDRVRLDGLAVLVLQQVAARAVQHAGAALGDRRRVPLGVDALAAGLEAVQADVGVVEEGVEDADRVRAAADARGDRASAARPVRSSTCCARLFADDLLEVAHHLGERVRAGDRAEDVVGGRRRS